MMALEISKIDRSLKLLIMTHEHGRSLEGFTLRCCVFISRVSCLPSGGLIFYNRVFFPDSRTYEYACHRCDCWSATRHVLRSLDL